MKKGSMIVIIIVFLFSIFMGYRYFEDKKETTSKDAVTFKKEYEALNNRVNPNNNKLYPEVSISNDNPVKYSSYDEIFEVLKISGNLNKETIDELKIRLGYDKETSRLISERVKIKMLEKKS